MGNLESRNPATIRQGNAIQLTARDVGQNERWVSRFTTWEKTADVANAITKHGHGVGLKFSNQNRRIRLRQFRFNQQMCPVYCVLKSIRWIQLNAHTPCITRPVSLVYRTAKCFFNQATVSGPELFTTSNRTARWITGFVVSCEYVLSEMSQCAGISNDASRAEAF